MYTTSDVKRLAGLAWDEFFRLVDHHKATKQTVSLPFQPKCNEDVAMLPYKKATCYGFCSVTETPKLVKCQNCGLVVKTVAFGHHQKIHHSHFFSPTCRSVSSDSDSDDDCQGFLLSPPHHPTLLPSSSETMLDLKFVEETKWTLSDALKSHSTVGGRNARNEKEEKTLRHSPPRYDVQRRNDLRLVLTKRRSPISRTRTHKAEGVCSSQSAPLVSISFTHSSGQNRNFIEIAEHNLTPKQTIGTGKMKRNASIRLNANEKCDNNKDWSNGQLTDEVFFADLEESEQSSIPLHHSPSESSDSDIEQNDQQCTETGGELLEEPYSSLPNDFVREKCPVSWNPRSAAERPSKSNNLALIHKMQQKKDVTRQQNDDSRDRAAEHSIDGNRKDRLTEQSPGISVLALSPDGKRKLAIPKQRQIPSNCQRDEIGTDSRSHKMHLPNEIQKVGSLSSPHSNLSFQRRLTNSSISSQSLSDESLQVLNTMVADESSESQKSEGNSRADSQPIGNFFAKERTTQQKTESSFAGVNWHKFGSQALTTTHCPPNVPKMPNAANQRKGTLRFVPFNSANENGTEQRQENSSKKGEKTTQIREENSAGNSSQQIFAETYDGDVRPTESDFSRSAEFVCPIRQNIHSSAAGTPNSAAFFGQKPTRKRSFIQQPKTNQQIQQQPIAAKRFRQIAPRKNEGTVGICSSNEDEIGPFSVQSRNCAAAVSQLQPNSSPCRPSNPSQISDQRFHPKILSVFSSPSSVPSFGDSVPGHVVQLSPPADFRTFGRQSRQLFSVRQYPQFHPTRQLRAQLTPFDAFGEDPRLPQFYDPRQTDGGHGSAAGLVAQRIPSEYSHSQMGKTTTPCAHLHPCPSPYAPSVGTPLAVPCSSAFLFASSLPAHPPTSSLINGPFPSVRQMSDSVPPSHQQQMLFHQQHFHPLAVLPSPQCRHSFARPSPSSVSHPFSVCRGGPFAGIASPHSESLFLPPSYAFQQCQQQQIPQRFLRGHQQQRHNRVVTYDNDEMDLEICAIEPPPVLEAEGNISASDEGPMRFEGGGGTTRSDSDASDMDLREILPQQQ
ncbi:hypothetical protein niasHT_015814 [Heterodera trifolii]|uniref:Uncharacterized protein n=1 Tax=Heterodera trifolii TaxID=157864 RepID=A0ABD2L4V2_9BILA